MITRRVKKRGQSIFAFPSDQLAFVQLLITLPPWGEAFCFATIKQQDVRKLHVSNQY